MIHYTTLRFEENVTKCASVLCEECWTCGVRPNLASVCPICKDGKEKKILDNNLLPSWTDDTGGVILTQPPELQDLRIGEMMLIQKVAPLVPLVHIRHGVMGSKGHVCSFPTPIDSVCRILPRIPADIRSLKMVRNYRGANGDVVCHEFMVRPKKVLAALLWLKKYNPLYHDIIIQEENLAWVGDREEAELVVQSDSVNVENEIDDTEDEPTDGGGPSPIQCKPTDKSHVVVETMGVLHNGHNTIGSQFDREVYNALKMVEDKKAFILPTCDPYALDEYSDIQLFALAFPWLFPGGVGGYILKKGEKRKHNLNLEDWTNYIIRYFDGRFQRDPLFCFFLLNYSTRRKNNKSGRWFVKSDKLLSGLPDNLEDLKESIAKGNTHFLNSLMYYSFSVDGSSGYWRQRRHELYSWISHHIDAGNGPPNLFMTLSCAEYMWPDIRRLVFERVQQTQHGTPLTQNDFDKMSFTSLVNDYTLIVQEFFQLRVEEFMETVGKELFGISHFWLRYEFAKGRGQIHVHMLAICAKESCGKSIYDILHEHKGDTKKQSEILSTWAYNKFRMSATYPCCNVDETPPCVPTSNDSIRTHYSHVQDRNIDMKELINVAMLHVCSDYCLREVRVHKSANNNVKPSTPTQTADGSEVQNKQQRVCRCGFGTELYHRSAKCGGAKLQDVSRIVYDDRNFKKLQMKRNSTHMVQTSLTMLQAWRANCDMQVLVYDSDPACPDAAEIGRVTDYVVAYTCKGNATFEAEREQMKSLIMR